MTWADRIRTAAASWTRWNLLPLEPRLDRVFKESGVRDLVVEREMLAGFVRAFVADTDPEYWPDGVADWLTTKEGS